MGARQKRICRIADSRELGGIVAELEEYTQLAHEGATFHIDEYHLVSCWLATPFAVRRDSDLLEESNWHVISEQLLTDCPDEVEIHHFGHWGCGWFKRLYVRRDGAAALRYVQGWLSALADYPAADDEDYSRRVWENDHPDDDHCYCDDAECSVKVRLLAEADARMAQDLAD